MIAKLLGILSAVLFGASAPFSKLLLNDTHPVLLAAFLYLGCGGSLLIIQLMRKLLLHSVLPPSRFVKSELPYLLGAVVAGGIIAPIVLLVSLSRTSAMTASILLNFEAVATSIIAFLLFKEHIGKWIWAALSFITMGSIVLTINTAGHFGISLWAFGILVACTFWGIDNNFTRKITALDPISIVIVKGITSGIVGIVLSMILGLTLPSPIIICKMLILGGVSYGLSLLLFIISLRELGAARASSLFGTAPFLGVIISYLIFKTVPTTQFIVSLPLIIIGVLILFREHHSHYHEHEELTHEHTHSHLDGHHEHHDNLSDIQMKHSHRHKHDSQKHDHEHFPDSHHRHGHKDK